ncbi:MAG TPA: sugar ABC transporter permease [Candidatus Izemoplasmatales bacterium]|nr:sugar ABC transporter permease [Candidatus Izemoplasmatales bacterium]
MEKKNNWRAILYLLPALILMGVFIFYPLVNAFYISFLDNYRPLLGTASGYTFANYTRVWNDQYFKDALKNTFVVAFISVPVSILISLLISVGLKSIKWLKGFFQTIFFLPYVTNAIAIGMAFAFMFHQEYGLVNVILGWFGIDPVNWIGGLSSWWAQMGALLIYSVWNGLAFKILVFTSGLQNIDKQYYDAAKIDSASKSRIFRKITIPLLSPFILYISITSMIGALKTYNSVVGLFGTKLGATPYSMVTIVAYVYNYVSGYTDVGSISRAAASAIILFIITVIFSLIQGVVSRKRVHY